MSFNNMSKVDLIAVAETFGVDINDEDGKGLSQAKLKTEILDNGVTWEMWTKHKTLVDEIKGADITEEDTEASALPSSSRVGISDSKENFRSAKINKYILKMDRENGTYEVRGYKFTSEHPYVIVEEADATWILQNQTGFRMATPLEAEQHYK